MAIVYDYAAIKKRQAELFDPAPAPAAEPAPEINGEEVYWSYPMAFWPAPPSAAQIVTFPNLKPMTAQELADFHASIEAIRDKTGLNRQLLDEMESRARNLTGLKAWEATKRDWREDIRATNNMQLDD